MTRRGVLQLELVAALTLIGGVCLVAVFAALGMQRPHVDAEDWKPYGGGVTTVPARRAESIHYVGIAAGGCAAANCHGGQNDEAQLGNEWKTSAFEFLQHDPHAQAYNVLFEERSRIMIDRLARGDEALATGKIPFPGDRKDVLWYAGQLETRCVSCHSTPLPATASNTTRGTLNDYALGVTCEACHGPASRWGDEHLSASWQTSSKEEIAKPIDKKATGFNELEDLSVAAATCAKCHIGNGEQIDDRSYREVTHDLIAAGHPRLDFDFAAWYASMPAHWNRAREQRAGFCTDSWLNGQVESLKTRQQSILAAFEFEKDDSAGFTPKAKGRADQPSAELDLARFDCFACHRALRFPPDAITYTPGAARFPLPSGSIWKVFAQIQPQDTDAFRASLESLYGGELPSAAGLKPEDVSAIADLTPAKLAGLLATSSSPSHSFDELLSWYYAADAVSRDAAFAAESSHDLQVPAKTVETCVKALKSEMERYLARSGEVSRYVSPSGFGISKADVDDTEKPNPQAVQAAFEEAKRALSTLAEKWSP